MSKWEKKRLNDICIKITDGSHNPPIGIEQSDFLMISSKNVYDDHISFYDPRYLKEEDFYSENKRTNIESGDVLLTIVGTIGRVAVVPKEFPDFTLQRSVAVLKPHKNLINSRFLMYALRSMTSFLEANARGVAQKGIYLKQVSMIEIPFPPHYIQLNIVEVLDKLLELLNLRKQQMEELDMLIKSVFHKMFGDSVNNERGWGVEKLDDITLKIGSGATPKGGRESYQNEGISLIRSMNVHNGTFKYNQLAYIDEIQAAKLKSVIVQENDILLNITGASVARSCIVPSDVLPARVNQHVAIIRVKANTLTPAYLNNVLTSKTFQHYLLSISEANGATREAITKQQLQNLKIPVPPLESQVKFSEIYYEILSLKKVIAVEITELQHLFDSLMSEYFD